MVAQPDFTSFPPARNFDAIIAIDEADPRFAAGMSASARIELDRLPDVLVVPDSGVFSGRRRGRRLRRAGRVGRAARRSPCSRRGRDRVAIAVGPQEGDRIALRDPTIEESQ